MIQTKPILNGYAYSKSSGPLWDRCFVFFEKPDAMLLA